MLKHLKIQNIILLEEAGIPFDEGLHVLSGESGSGKSAIMQALSLILGERSDHGMIRRGSEKGVVEAVIEIQNGMQIRDLFEEMGIEHDESHPLIIRREIHLSGKNRSFINQQPVQLAVLKKIGKQLIDLVGQHANQKLLSTDYHRQIIDCYGEIAPLAKDFTKSWEEEKALNEQMHQYIASEASRLREIETCRRELTELKEAHLREGEEEELFAEYSLLAHAEELAQKVSQINQILSGDRQGVLVHLTRQKMTLEQLVTIDPTLQETAKTYLDALLDLQEVSYELQRYQSRIEQNPLRAAELNERLGLINLLKKRYGNSISQILAYQESCENRLNALENTDIAIETLRESLEKTKIKTDQIATELSKKRKMVAQRFEKAMTQELKDLNMPKATFHVQITPQERNGYGDEKIEFFLIPNLGESSIGIKDCASGGELARVMLALKILMADKDLTPTLIFDEVDANIGGETATVIGNKLKQISNQRQVLCITHFPQVAKQAHHHFQISKKECEGRTTTEIKRLDEKDKEKELIRMLGGDSLES